MKESELGWLAGIWDGEGSVGLFQSRPSTWVLQLQMSMTCEETIQRVIDLLRSEGVNVRGPYQYAEKKEYHKPAYALRLTGLGNVQKTAYLIQPYAVTKRRLWELAQEWCDRRIELAGGLNERGHLKRGGHARKGYTEDDHRIIEEVQRLNDSRRRAKVRGVQPEGAGGGSGTGAESPDSGGPVGAAL